MNEREQGSRVMPIGLPDPESVLWGRYQCEGCGRVGELPLADRASFVPAATERGWKRLPRLGSTRHGDGFRFLCPRCAKARENDGGA